MSVLHATELSLLKCLKCKFYFTWSSKQEQGIGLALETRGTASGHCRGSLCMVSCEGLTRFPGLCGIDQFE